MNCKEASQHIHEHLDDELMNDKLVNLQLHLNTCEPCKKHYEDLVYTGTLIRSLKIDTSNINLSKKIMNRIRANPKRKKWITWMSKYPGISVAIIFTLLMLSSYIMMWNQDQEFAVKTNDLDKVIIQGHTVMIPKNQIIEGNVVVRNGNIKVDGDVHGDLVVMDGNIILASTAHISGNTLEINQAFKWLWYEVNEYFVKIFYD